MLDCSMVVSYIIRSSYETNLLHCLATDTNGLARSQGAVEAFFQVAADLSGNL